MACTRETPCKRGGREEKEREERRFFFLKGRGDNIEGERAVFLRVLKKKKYWLNWRKKLRTGERRVVGKSPLIDA